jgi:hypothetical protein
MAPAAWMPLVLAPAPWCDLVPPPKSAPMFGSRQQTMSPVNGGDNAGDLSDLVQVGSAGNVAAEAGTSGIRRKFYEQMNK